MRLLLINNNPAVSRLINLSAKKYGYEIEEFKSDDFDLNENYDVTITDNEAVSENSILLLRESGNLGDIIYIGPKGLPKPVYANYFLQKPFLPTDFIDMIKKIEKSKEEKEIKDEIKDRVENKIEEDLDNDGMMALDLDELDSLDLPMPDDGLHDDEGKEIANGKELEELQEDTEEILESEDNPKIDDIASESDVEQVVDELSEEELSISNELDDEDFKLDTKDDVLTEKSPSILDSEDIDEVKQLLVDDIEDEETEIVEEEIEDDEELIDENNDMEDAKPDIDTGFDELVQEVEDTKKPEEIFQEIESIQEENIEEDTENTSEDEVEDTESTKEETVNDLVDTGIEKSSIEDLEQEDLIDLFGIEENETKGIDVNQLKEELQTKIEEDVKNTLNKDEIKEALKGLTLNISISFDEEQE